MFPVTPIFRLRIKWSEIQIHQGATKEVRTTVAQHGRRKWDYSVILNEDTATPLLIITCIIFTIEHQIA